ncbi:MAG: hypothetical protein JXK16_10260, partial [Thiotrichales bacterium]|nr:hypothetical protein [Thiotrichales bacterium]
SSIQTKIDEQSSSAQLNAIAGQYWQLNNTSTLEGSMTNGNSSTWSMVSLQPNLLTASVSDEQLSFTLAENGSLSIGQLIDYAGEQKTQQMRSIDPGKIASGIPATLNSDNSLSIPEITPTVGQTGSENLFGGNNYNYSITYAKSSGMMPFYKDSVTQRYAYIHLNTQAKQFGEDINNWKILETSLTLVLPKINTNTGVLANVAGHTYGGIILQSQYPTPMGTSLNLGLEIADFVVETSRWSIDPSGNLTRPASAQNAVKLKYFPNGIGLGYNGEDFPNHDSSRIDRTATVVENGNLGGTTTATWGENDNSTRQVAYTPDGMIAMLNKHHTNFDQVNPSPVYDCADSNAVIDQAINTCQLGTRLAVKLPDTGGTVTNATITDSLNGKTYRFLGMQIQGNTQGDLVELFSGPVEATFGKSGSSLTLAITQTDATSSTLRYQGEPGQVTTVEATDANASETLANPLIAFTETSDSLTEASTRLGEFELAQTGNDNESGLANGDPETMAHPPGTHIRFFMSQDGADSDTAPDVVIGAVYSENSNDATDSQRDKSVWLLMGTPAITTEPVIFLD